jgi:hypothetical protein
MRNEQYEDSESSEVEEYYSEHEYESENSEEPEEVEMDEIGRQNIIDRDYITRQLEDFFKNGATGEVNIINNELIRGAATATTKSKAPPPENSDSDSKESTEKPLESKIEIVSDGSDSGSLAATSEIKDYRPVLTSDGISLFEYVRVITCLAEALFEMKSICKYIQEYEINYIINPCELAFLLLEAGKFDAVIDRKCEKVLYSNLKINPKWKYIITEYYKNHHQAINSELLSGFSLEQIEKINIS